MTARGLLLVRQQRGDRTYWLLPGGGVRFGESVADALRRELREELALDVAPGRPLALAEAISDDMTSYPKHVIHVICAATLADAAAEARPSDAAVLGAQYFERGALGGLELRPPIAAFLDSCFDALPRDLQYLGLVW